MVERSPYFIKMKIENTRNEEKQFFQGLWGKVT